MITTFVQWLFQIVIAGVTPRLITSIGYGTYIVYGVFCVISAVWCWWGVPETRGVKLEEMGKLFEREGGTEEDGVGEIEEVDDMVEVGEGTSLLGGERRESSWQAHARRRRSSVAHVV